MAKEDAKSKMAQGSNPHNKVWGEDIISDIVRKIDNKMIVPIIGYGVFYADYNGKKVPVQDYIVRRIVESEDLEDVDNVTLYSDGIRGMTKLARTLVGMELDIETCLVEQYEKEDFYTHVHIDENVRLFLEKGQFPLIVSTTNFNFISRLFEREGLKYNLVSYQGGQSKGQDIKLNECVIEEPTIFNIFGTVGPNVSSVISEEDMLTFLHYILDTNTAPQNLKTYLHDPKTKTIRNVITLGCEIPDWTFRLLLYSLKEQEGKLNSFGGKKTFVGGYVSQTLDQNLWDFLTDIKYKVGNDFSYLQSINHKLNDFRPKGRIKIFISLPSEDYDDVGEQIKQLLNPHYDVWLFKYDGTRQYWNSIRTGIAQCRYFMPVVTPSAILRLQELKDASHIMPDEDGGLMYEWALALSNQRNKYDGQVYCIPYLVKVRMEQLKGLLLEKDKEKENLWPLFFPYDGIDAITDNLTLEKLQQYIAEEKESNQQK